MITVRKDAVRTQGRAPRGGGGQRDREAVGSSSRLEARFRSRIGGASDNPDGEAERLEKDARQAAEEFLGLEREGK